MRAMKSWHCLYLNGILLSYIDKVHWILTIIIIIHILPYALVGMPNYVHIGT